MYFEFCATNILYKQRRAVIRTHKFHTLIFKVYYYFTLLFSDSICTNDDLEEHLKDICVQVETNENEERSDDDTIRANSQCEEDIKIKLDSVRGANLSIKRKIGMCYMGTNTRKCLTKGSVENEFLAFTYTNGKCHDPQKVTYIIPKKKKSRSSRCFLLCG